MQKKIKSEILYFKNTMSKDMNKKNDEKIYKKIVAYIIYIPTFEINIVSVYIVTKNMGCSETCRPKNKQTKRMSC